MRIAIDAMGGDHAPDEIIAGALEAREVLGSEDELLLIGDEQVIESHLHKLGASPKTFRVLHASDVIGMDESPVEALRRKPKSSISIMARAASHRQVDAVLSAGNTGACVAGCQLRMRNLKGVLRPGIALAIPTISGPVTLCDVGANIACKPINLYQYAVMSSIYAREIHNIKNPRVPNLNFIGNLEGGDIFEDKCDVVVCEGFLGNVILKTTESLAGMIFTAVGTEMKKQNLLMAWWFKKISKDVLKKYDYHEYGGALLLGVNGISVICHGSSKARTIKNAVSACKRFADKHINEQIIDRLSQVTVETNGQ